MRGRVIAVDGEVAVIRSERRDARVPADPNWRPGDLVETDWQVEGTRLRPDNLRFRAYDGPPYPGPRTEVVRLPRERIAILQQRGAALEVVRGHFASKQFIEVETPLLVPSPGLELHLDAVPAGSGFLITSPEYQMKRLLAAGFERIYQVCKCFRANERGPHHASEFTMIEWYRAYESLDAIITDTEELVSSVCGGIARIGDRIIPLIAPWRRMTVRDAMQRWAGITVRGDEPAVELVAAVRAAGISIAYETAWDDAFFAAFLARVEPAIAALDHPLILSDWPAPLAALARRRPDDPLTALRFEAYVGGIELANAFDELTDPIEQRARFEDDLRIRRERGRATYPIDDKLLAALAEGLPPSAGIALGFDRLVMLATGATSIDQVLTFTAGEL